MNNLYLDTNFFIYLSEKSSPYYLACFKFIKYCKKDKLFLTTSPETIQEIIHLAKNTRQLDKGLKIAQNCLEIVDEVLPVNKATIEIYLEKASIYKTASSRDLIHLAVCLENKINRIVTFDKDFARFKEIKILQPQMVIT